MEDKFDIKVKSYASQPQMASYLMRAFLALRDRENASQSVKLMGSGGAIPFVILVTEIIRSRYQNVTSISEFEQMEKDIDGRIINIPAIRVKLTLKPNEEDKQKPGYQPPTNNGEEKIIDLFDYVMLYTRDLYALKMHGKQNRERERDRDRRSGNNKDNKEYYNRNRNNNDDKEYRDRNNNNIRRGNQHERSQDWRKDREDFQKQQQQQEDHHQSQDWRKDREEFQKQHQQEDNHQTQYRTRGTQRRNNNAYEYRESNVQRVSRPRDQQRQEQEQFQNQDSKLRQGAVIRRGGPRRE